MSPEGSTENLSVSTGKLQEVKQWSAVLSRYAALLGESVTDFTFENIDTSADGIATDNISPVLRVLEVWRARFPAAQIDFISPEKLNSDSFPLLLFNESNLNIFLIRGRAGPSSLLCETQNGEAIEKSWSEIGNENYSVFSLSKAQKFYARDQSDLSASEWFSAAIVAHRGLFAEAIFATLIVSLIGLGSAMYTMQVYDRVVPTQGYSTLVVLLVGVLIAVILELTLKQMRARIVDRACKSIDESLSSIFFGKALDIRLDARPKLVGTFASQIRHFESVRNFMTSSTLFIFADAPFAIFFIGVIATIGGAVAIVPLIIFPMAIFLGLAFRKPIQKYTELHMTESNKKNGLLIEAVDGIESLKAVNADWKLMNSWNKLTRIIAEGELKMRSLSTMSTNLTQTIQQLSYIGMISLGAYLITQGDLTMGALIACSIVGGRALAPLAQIPSLIVQWKQAKIALDILDNIMRLPGERPSNLNMIVPTICHGHIGLEKIQFSYEKEVVCIECPALKIEPGERIAIVGAIGAGKSTLLKILSGLLQSQDGSMTIDGIDLRQISPEFVRQNFGYLPQDVRLFSGTLRDNLLLGLPIISDGEIIKACEATGLNKIISAHPLGLDLEIAEGGKGLSGGQRQLVGLTRLLLAKPKVLLMDEPTASMDVKSEQLVMQHLFNEIPKNHTVIVVTHKVTILPHVDRIIIVDNGKIIADGPRNKIIAALKAKNDTQNNQ